MLNSWATHGRPVSQYYEPMDDPMEDSRETHGPYCERMSDLWPSTTVYTNASAHGRTVGQHHKPGCDP